jgi:DNA invertase Pin-like site-specific DNA recombinase
MRTLSAGDVVLVTRLDRLARSTRDLLNTLAAFAEKQAGFRSLQDAWADTTTPHGRLMLTVLGSLAEFERELIRARTGEGRQRARDRGVLLGRKPKLTPHQKLWRPAHRRVQDFRRPTGPQGQKPPPTWTALPITSCGPQTRLRGKVMPTTFPLANGGLT